MGLDPTGYPTGQYGVTTFVAELPIDTVDEENEPFTFVVP